MFLNVQCFAEVLFPQLTATGLEKTLDTNEKVNSQKRKFVAIALFLQTDRLF